MRATRRSVCALLACLVCAGLCAPGLAANETAYTAPRGPGGKPDLSGTWQAMNRANFDLEHHPARAAMAFREGPAGPVPAKEVVARVTGLGYKEESFLARCSAKDITPVDSPSTPRESADE